MPLFRSQQSGRRNYAAHGFSSCVLVLGYAAYLFFQSPPVLDSLTPTTGTLAHCAIERHSSRHGHSLHVVLSVMPDGGGQQESFELDQPPWSTSQSCTMLNPYVGRSVSVSHSRNPDPMGYLNNNFRDIVWQLQSDGQTIVDYPAQTGRWRKHTQWMTEFMGGFGLVLLVIALFEQRRGTG